MEIFSNNYYYPKCSNIGTILWWLADSMQLLEVDLYGDKALLKSNQFLPCSWAMTLGWAAVGSS